MEPSLIFSAETQFGTSADKGHRQSPDRWDIDKPISQSVVLKSYLEIKLLGNEFDARLALAEIEMKAGQMTAGRAHLTAIEADALVKGYILVARKAAIARG